MSASHHRETPEAASYPSQQWANNGPPPAPIMLAGQHQMNQQPQHMMQPGYQQQAPYSHAGTPAQQQFYAAQPSTTGRFGNFYGTVSRNGYKVAGLYVAAQCIVCLCMLGIFATLVGCIITGVGFSQADDWDDVPDGFEDFSDDNPFETMKIVGPVVISIGALFLISGGVLGWLAYKQSRKLATGNRTGPQFGGQQNQESQMLAPSARSSMTPVQPPHMMMGAVGPVSYADGAAYPGSNLQYQPAPHPSGFQTGGSDQGLAPDANRRHDYPPQYSDVVQDDARQADDAAYSMNKSRQLATSSSMKVNELD